MFGGKGKLRVDAGHVHEDRRGGDSLDLPESEAMTAESIDSTRDHAGASFLHRPRAQLDYRLTASFVHTARDTYYGSSMDPNAYGSSENPLWVLDGQVNRYGRNRILSAGVQWTSDHLEDAQPAYERFTDETHRNFGVYAQDDWSIARGVQLLYGMRADKQDALESLHADAWPLRGQRRRRQPAVSGGWTAFVTIEFETERLKRRRSHDEDNRHSFDGRISRSSRHVVLDEERRRASC